MKKRKKSKGIRIHAKVYAPGNANHGEAIELSPEAVDILQTEKPDAVIGDAYEINAAVFKLEDGWMIANSWDPDSEKLGSEYITITNDYFHLIEFLATLATVCTSSMCIDDEDEDDDDEDEDDDEDDEDEDDYDDDEDD